MYRNMDLDVSDISRSFEIFWSALHLLVRKVNKKSQTLL